MTVESDQWLNTGRAIAMFVTFVAFACAIRPRAFRFYCIEHDGEFVSKHPYPDHCTICNPNTPDCSIL